MFNGSENLPGDFFTYLQQIGATDYNGTTWFDRTNYFQTVPKGALERALFMECDRMGYLLGAVTQEKLDNQRGVVQNEKRQGDNQPGGLVDYEVLDNLFPEGHPYHHSTDRLDGRPRRRQPGRREAMVHRQIRPQQCRAGAGRRHQRRPRRGRWSRNISARSSAGPVNMPGRGRRADAGRAQVDRDEGPRRRGADPAPLGGARACCPTSSPRSTSAARSSAASPARGSTRSWCATRSSRSAVTAGLQPFQRIGMFEVTATVKPGVDPALVEKRLDEIIAEFHRQRPDRGRSPPRRDAATSPAASAGSSRSAASAARRSRWPRARSTPATANFYKTHARPICARSRRPTIRAAMQQWLSRPAFTVRLEPGDRPPYVEAKGRSRPRRRPTSRRRRSRAADPADRRRAAARLPRRRSMSACRTASRSHYAQRTAVPIDPARPVVRRRLRGRCADRPRPAESDA